MKSSSLSVRGKIKPGFFFPFFGCRGLEVEEEGEREKKKYGEREGERDRKRERRGGEGRGGELPFSKV